MLPEVWIKEINNCKDPVNWVQETALQMIKDFSMLDLPVEISALEKGDYGQLFTEAKQILEDLYVNHYHTFINLLYRIDVPESMLGEHIQGLHGDALYQMLTEIILRREFMKVVYRQRYSR